MYGTAAYTILLGTFAYAVGFIGRFIVPKTVNSGGAVPPLYAIVVDLVLLGLCAIQHNGVVRKAVVRLLRRHASTAIDRSTYVLCSCLAVIALFAFWQPVHTVVWRIDSLPIAFLVQLLSTIGWLMVLYGTLLAGHCELFGLKQVACNFAGGAMSGTRVRAPAVDRVIRHQICFGFMIAFWATPKMTAGQLLLAAATTIFVFVATRSGRRSLVAIGTGIPAL